MHLHSFVLLSGLLVARVQIKIIVIVIVNRRSSRSNGVTFNKPE